MAKILIADDDPDAREVLVAILAPNGYQVLQASDGAEALELVQVERPDLLITDILMPTMDGFEVVERMRRDRAIAQTPAIFYTATYHEREARALANQCGILATITKPCDPQMVLWTVEAALGLRPSPAPPPSGEEFDREHLHFLTTHLTAKFTELEAANQRLAALLDLGLSLASELDPLPLLQNFCHAARHLLAAQYAAVDILDEDGKTLRHFFTSGLDREVAARTAASSVIAELRAKVLEGGSLVHVNLTGKNQRDLQPGAINIACYLGMPIATPAHVYGFLCLANKVGVADFTTEDEAVIRTLAVQLAVAYENTCRFEAIQQEITQRKSSEEALRRSEEITRLIVDTALDAVITMDAAGLITMWNSQAERVFGWPREEAVGRRMAETIMPPQHREAHTRGLQHFLETGEGPVLNKRIEMTALHRDGREFPVELAISPVKMGGAWTFSAFVRDVTERQRADEEIRRLNESLERRVLERTAELAAVNKELEAFSYSVAHDLRAPLRGMDGFCKLLREEFGLELGSTARHYLLRIEEAARHMGQLVDELLDLGRVARQALNRQVTGMNSLVKEVLEDLKPELEGRQIDWQIDELPFMECDSVLMKQVFANLLSNAVKFTRPRKPALIQVGQVAVDGQRVVFVRDNGVGFNMKHAGKLFGVFQRLHRPEDFDGTGVGLATVQRIIHKHGGQIWAEAELDKGATFYFTLGGAEKTVSENKVSLPVGGTR